MHKTMIKVKSNNDLYIFQPQDNEIHINLKSTKIFMQQRNISYKVLTKILVLEKIAALAKFLFSALSEFWTR